MGGGRVPVVKLNGRFALVGGAGFIGSHLVDRLLAEPGVDLVTVYDNFSSGRTWHLGHHGEDPRLRVVDGDVADQHRLDDVLRGHATVVHLASNPDIARAATEPSIDFDQGTLLTHNVAEACRGPGVATLLYASGSGVYGDVGDREVDEDWGPLVPISTYGASKLAGEALICSYAHMFGLRARAFRFANVVGPRQTHGVGFDFVRRLLQQPDRLSILGDGTQSKSYIHVADVAEAVLLGACAGDQPFAVYNVSTGDHITVTEIASMVVECLGLDPAQVVYEYRGGDRGWRGDVPVVRLSTERIRALGWRCTRTSAEALREAIIAMIPDARAGRL